MLVCAGVVGLLVWESEEGVLDKSCLVCAAAEGTEFRVRIGFLSTDWFS
jgi:hypothetical protein